MAKIKTTKSAASSGGPSDSAAPETPIAPAKPAVPTLQTLDPMLLNGLVCPKSRTPLIYDREANELISKKAKLAYPIREGVPIMLIDEARDIS